MYRQSLHPRQHSSRSVLLPSHPSRFLFAWIFPCRVSSSSSPSLRFYRLPPLQSSCSHREKPLERSCRSRPLFWCHPRIRSHGMMPARVAPVFAPLARGWSKHCPRLPLPLPLPPPLRLPPPLHRRRPRPGPHHRMPVQALRHLSCYLSRRLLPAPQQVPEKH